MNVSYSYLYEQITPWAHDTKMGTKMGPSYANLFADFIKKQFFSQYPTAPNLNSTAVALTTASVLPPLHEGSSLNL